MRPPLKPTNVNAVARKVDVDNRIPLRNYYRIADNLLRQANVHREEKNVIELYIMLLRYSSLIVDTIPRHRDYQTLYTKERAYYKKKLIAVIDELESLKPKFQPLWDEYIKEQSSTKLYQHDVPERTTLRSDSSSLEWPPVNDRYALSLNTTQPPYTSWKQDNDRTQPSKSIDSQFQKLSLSVPLPTKETLSRHSFLGPNGLHGQWMGPSVQKKVQYPTYIDPTPDNNLSLNEVVQYDTAAVKDSSKIDGSTMESLLSLDDGRWSSPSFSNNDTNSYHNQLNIIRQPSPPPVLAQVQPEYAPISPSRVADPRPGPAIDGNPTSSSYQHLHIPVKMMDDFLRLAQANTRKNLETCGVLAGSLKNRMFHITTLIIPKQESTSDSCQTLNEEEIFDYQDKRSLFPLGWIHTHPSQTCFMSSVDLHTHYSYQVMLPEAIAIVMAPTDLSSPHGIFHLSDPSGVSVIRKCDQRGFHPHEESEDGNPIYEHCSHVYMNPNMKFEVADLR
jgi:STAM-binding protein